MCLCKPFGQGTVWHRRPGGSAAWKAGSRPGTAPSERVEVTETSGLKIPQNVHMKRMQQSFQITWGEREPHTISPPLHSNQTKIIPIKVRFTLWGFFLVKLKTEPMLRFIKKQTIYTPTVKNIWKEKKRGRGITWQCFRSTILPKNWKHLVWTKASVKHHCRFLDGLVSNWLHGTSV